jgi:hypothetical protein
MSAVFEVRGQLACVFAPYCRFVLG